MAISRHAKFAFAKSDNHCRTFSEVIGFANSKADNVGELLNDLANVFIGADYWRERGQRGPYWVGTTNDSGFKAEFRDQGSPQIEHAVAGMSFGKKFPPGVAEIIGFGIEAVQGALGGATPNGPDTRLYNASIDLSARLSQANRNEFEGVVRRALCQ
jgi:hypothetical protein